MISARDEAALAQTTGEIREVPGAEVDYHATDLTRVDDVRALVKRTVERFGAWTSLSPTPEVLPPVLLTPSRTRIGVVPSSRT